MRDIFWILFLPLSWLWAAIYGLRRNLHSPKRSHQAPVPIICVGNIHSGGSGKTPLVVEIARHFALLKPGIMSRGYRGQLSNVGARVDRNSPRGAALYGDEPWMLSQMVDAPIFIGRDRANLIPLIKAEPHCAMVIMDDGFQHFSLRRDVDLVAISTLRSCNDSFCLPAGDLREPLSAIRFASAVVLTHDGPYRELWEHYLREGFPNIPLFHAIKKNLGIWANGAPARDASEIRYGAFCGLADPTGFSRDVARLPNAVFLKTFPDHHLYTEKDLTELVASKDNLGIDFLLTTEKDWAKVREPFARRKLPSRVMRIGYELPADFWIFIKMKLDNRRT